MIGVGGREIHLLDYWAVLVKRRWIVLTVLAAVTTTVTLATLLQVPIYTATSRLQIERHSPNVVPFQQVAVDGPDYSQDFYETQHALIRSRSVAREVVRSLKLHLHPSFKVSAPGEEDPHRSPEEILEARLVRRLLAGLEVKPVGGSRLVDVSFSSTDPRLAARVANRVTETFIEFNSRARYNTTERAASSLATQMANLQDEIEGLEQQLQAYAREHGIIPINEKQDITVKALSDLSDARSRARSLRIEKEARYDAMRSATPESLPEVFANPLVEELTARTAALDREYAELSEKYRPGWPKMAALRREREATEARLAQEKRAIYERALESGRNDYQAALNEETSLQSALDELKRQSQELGLKEIEYNKLKLEIANKRQILEALVRRQSETDTTAGLSDLATSNIRIVDAAEIPSAPSSPRIGLNIGLGLFVGLALGVLLAFVFEYADDSVRDSESLQAIAGIPAIGLIPALRREGLGLRLVQPDAASERGGRAPGVDLASQEDLTSEISEAFRDLRTAVLVSRPGRPPRSILVTSANPYEGKTATALNLALTLAQAGRRVLLVDADMRKPRLHRALSLANSVGVSNALSGVAEARPRPASAVLPGVDVLTSGPVPPNPADLLDAEGFQRLIGDLAGRGYDHIIYDSPPVLPVADASIVARHMDAVLLVVWSGVTRRDALARVTARLRQAGAPLIGGVLNRVESRKTGYYGRYSGGKEASGGDDPAVAKADGRPA